MALWNSLSDTGQAVVQVSAAIGGLTIIYVAGFKLFGKLKKVYQTIMWMLSEQHDHDVIKEALDKITAQLTRNGGHSIVDSLDRIEQKQDFMGAHVRASLHANKKALFETDSSGHVVYVNRAYKKLFGVGSEDVNGMGWVNVIDEVTRDQTVKAWFRAVRGNRDFDETLSLVNADGVTFQAHVTAYLIRSGDSNSLLGHVGEVIPNTEI